MAGDLDPSTLSDRELMLVMYTELKATRQSLDAKVEAIEARVGSWKCPNQQCKDHEAHMDAQDADIDQIGECVMRLQDHEKIIIGAVVLVISVFGLYLVDRLLGG
jgi:hypothetical protein